MYGAPVVRLPRDPGLSVDVEQLHEVCSRYGVERLDVFGSVSRGDALPDSDIDVLYELEPEARLGWDIEKLADELSAQARSLVAGQVLLSDPAQVDDFFA